MDPDLIEGLLSQLKEDISRRDGESAVRTVEWIRVVAGPEFTDRLVNELIQIGLRRAAGLGIATDRS
jgi:hypothetical protein